MFTTKKGVVDQVLQLIFLPNFESQKAVFLASMHILHAVWLFLSGRRNWLDFYLVQETRNWLAPSLQWKPGANLRK